MTLSGISKQVKDHIRACAHCQSKRSAEDISGFRIPQPERAEEGEEDEEEDSLFLSGAKMATKHELVFVC